MPACHIILFAVDEDGERYYLPDQTTKAHDLKQVPFCPTCKKQIEDSYTGPINAIITARLEREEEEEEEEDVEEVSFRRSSRKFAYPSFNPFEMEKAVKKLLKKQGHPNAWKTACARNGGIKQMRYELASLIVIFEQQYETFDEICVRIATVIEYLERKKPDGSWWAHKGVQAYIYGLSKQENKGVIWKSYEDWRRYFPNENQD